MWNSSGELRKAVAQVLDESMPAAEDVSRGGVPEAPHGIHALLEVLMVALKSIV
jgi:hypothetical protein